MDQRTVKTGRVFVLPRISRELRDLRCCDGDAVTFECLVEGTPAPSVQWEKDGLLIPEGGDFKMDTDGETARLSITCVYPEDEGVYSCIAHNELGKAYTSSCLIVDVPEEKENLLSQQLTRPAMLLSAGSTPRSTPRGSPRSTPARSVSPHRPATRQRERVSRSPSRGSRWKMCPPKFFAVPFNRVAEEGETVSFRCSIAGHPTPIVTWDKDGCDIPVSSRFSIRENDEDRILQIIDVKYEDSGMYRVTLDNEVGRVEAAACLDVISLRGSYHAVRTTDASRTSPSVRRHLSGSQSRTGDRLRLSAEIRGSPSPHSKWYRNGQQLKMSDRVFEIREGSTFNLVIDHAEVSDSGDYCLVVSNESGEASSWAKVNVINTIFDSEVVCIGKHQPRILEELKDIRAMDGKAVEILLKVENCCIFSFSWMKDNKVLPDSDIFKYVDHGNGLIGLRLEDIYVQDSGIYTCVIENAIGLCKSSCRVSVEDNTAGLGFNGISSYPKPTIVEESNDAFFTLMIDDSPGLLDAKVVWQISGVIVDKDSDKYKLSSEGCKHSIKLTKVEGIDSGVVRCAIRLVNENSEEYESLWYTTQMTVVPRAHLHKNRCVEEEVLINYKKKSIVTPKKINSTCDEMLKEITKSKEKFIDTPKQIMAEFLNKIEDITIPKGGKICLQASFQGYPEPEVRWFKSEQELVLCDRIMISKSPGKTSLVIQEAELRDSDKYKLMIENPLGKRHLYVKLTVEDNEESNNKPQPLYNIDDGNLFDSKYKIYNVIGRGHFGSVKLVVDKRTGEKLAAKFVKIVKPKDREITISELEIMHCLKHPKLIQLIDAFVKMNQMIIVTEYVSGGQLFERVSEEDFTLTERDCILFMTQILEGVCFMHSKSIVHLDLKPENIMCHTRPSHEIKIIDFGLAKRLNPNEEVRTLCGTAEFIAPEVVNFDPISTASDMWSVGVICYILLSGLSPFAGDTVQETYSNILRVKYDFDDDSFDNISEDAKEFIKDLLVKPMDKRPSAAKCMQTKWMKQHREKRNSTALSTEKLRKFVIQSKWQMTGNAIRAVGRMATLCAISRMNSSRLLPKPAIEVPLNTPIQEETAQQNAGTDRDQQK